MTRQFPALTAALLFLVCSNSQAATEVAECKQLFDEALWEQALAPCIKAAEAHDLPSQSILGELYDRQGNSERTRHWWSLAASAGYEPARNQLALKYFYGGSVFGKEEGWTQDYAKAFEIWQQDALQGVITAQFMVGEMYLRGNGVAKDLAEAWAWLSLAKYGGYKMAGDSLFEVSGQITPAQRKDGMNKLTAYQKQINSAKL